MKSLNKYFNNRVKAVLKLLKKSPVDFRPEVFHKLRVEIKKINAVTELINFADKDFKQRKLLGKIRKVFKSAGSIRDYQLEEKFFFQFFPSGFLESYRSELRINKRKERKYFFELLDKGVRSSIKRKLSEIQIYLKSVKRKDLEDFLESRAEEIKELIKEGRADLDKLHELRRETKRYFYLNKIIKVNNNSVLYDRQEMIAVLLVNYHDLQVMLENIRKGLLQPDLSESERLQVMDVQMVIESKSRHTLKLVKEGLYPDVLLAEN